MLHCWADGPVTMQEFDAAWILIREVGSTCMAERGHAGPHEFVSDSEITIHFPPFQGKEDDDGEADVAAVR